MDVAHRLRLRKVKAARSGADDLVLPSRTGTVMQAKNLRERVFFPAAQAGRGAVGGFHTLRHTCASMVFAGGRNAKQVAVWLGHTEAAFPLRTYITVLDGDVGGGLDLPPSA